MPELIPNILASVTARPKSGKNHFSYTWPAPIRVYCFNGGAEFVRNKAKFKDKKIDIINIDTPIIEESEVAAGDHWAKDIWKKLNTQYKKDLSEKVYKTYIFDTGTELETLVRRNVTEIMIEESTKDRTKLAVNEYGDRNMIMYAIFDRAKKAGVNLIMLQYVKEKWTKDSTGKPQPTGEIVMDGWAQTEAAVDVPLELEEKSVPDSKGQPRSVNILTIKPNRFSREMNRKTIQDATYDDLTATLFGG